MIPVYKPYLHGNEKTYVNQCLDSTWISSKGEFITKFEQQFGEYIGSDFVTSVCNGTVALHLALETLGISTGDEIIVPTLTYVASVNTIRQVGAIPVFVDSLTETLQIDPDDIIKKITPKTRAVMAVHLYGQACDMARLIDICKEHNLLLIEDCAEAFGTQFQGQHVGTFGDIATFSFFGNKTITTGEGGMVVAKSKQLIEKARHLKNQAVSPDIEYWHDVIGYNYRMTNICAAIGLAQLEQINDILTKKRQIAQWYREKLSGLPLVVHGEQAGTIHSYWMCTILVNESSKQSSLRDELKAKGIETRPVFYPVHTLPPYKTTHESFPHADDISARGINLPSYPDLTQKEVDLICSSIHKYFNQFHEVAA